MAALLTLNATALRNRVAELGLRQWWLAEQLNVDRRTVLRWLNGQVRSIAPDRAEDLAVVLGCPVTELLLHEPATQLASPEDQRRAGAALATSQLLDRLGPVGEWDVAEQLIRAAAVPDLPVHVLGRLYHQLSVACWRQDKLAEATAHNASALDLAQRCGDRALLADALGSGANLAFWRGDVGAALVDTGQLAQGHHHLRAALACFEQDGMPMNHAIAHGNLALLALQVGDIAALADHSQRARQQAQRADYRRGLAFSDLLDAVAAAHQQDGAATQALLSRGLDAFAAQGIAESLNHRLAAEAWWALGDVEAARAAAADALRLSAGFPVERQAAEALSRRVTGAAAAAPLPSRPSHH